MFNEEKKQYAEDCKNYERPWELWQSALTNNGILNWIDLYREPNWSEYCVYRRKQIEFVPEYFSGLNWRDAEHLVGKTVEYTDNPDIGWNVGTLKKLCDLDVISRFGIGLNECINVHFYTYIRTCEEKLKHPTINIGGVELPMPEIVAPTPGTVYWMLGFGAPVTSKDGSLYDMGVWPKDISKFEKEALKNGSIHITEERAKTWADWWKTNVIDKMQ